MSADMQPQPQPQQRHVPPSRRRDKPILSCNLCRRRKLKCDRQQPCKTCVDRGLSLSCTYSRNAATSATSAASNPATNVHDRIDQLERLVTTLMDAKGSGDRRRSTPHSAHASPFRPDPNDISADAEAPGTPVHMTLDSDETKYTDSSHWMSILDSIAELKGELDQITSDPPSVDSPEDHPGPELLFGTQKHATRQDIIAGLPPKSEADILMDRYWRFVDVAPTIMHRPKFQREYDEFWQNPTETPTMWIGMLYGLFAIATRIQSLIEEHDGGLVDPSHRTFSEARQDFYRQKVAQCLILANYLKCPPFTMETFLGYFVIEYLRSQDTQHGIWLLVGMLVRTAFRMGLHREPSKLSDNKLTPFECEMRRRMWSMVVRLDLMSSGQVGLPRMIHSAMADTMEPSNLNDDDIHEGMTELPPSRSDTEYTPMLYTIIRNRVLTVFARVTDLVSSSEQPTYREILELDEELRTMFENIPESLKCKGAKEFDMTLPSSMPVLLLNLTFLKGLEMLHRPFLFMARADSRYEYSRAACVDAALEILDFQHTLECQSTIHKTIWAERPLWWTSSWRLSSMMNHDFFLATTVLALDLDRDLVDPVPSSDVERVRFKSGQPTRAEIIEALVRVNDQIWARASHTSREARRVFSAVRYVLGKAGVGTSIPKVPSGYTQPPSDLPIPHQQPPDTSLMFDLNNTPFPTYPTDNMQMDYGESFDWAGFENSYPMNPFGQNVQSYFGSM